ncbi:MAG: isoprenylcysteine carboxylmethyltransferase family protein [Candidatus Micrarchaeota archaeon]
MDSDAIKKRALLLFPAAFVVLSLMFFLTAGTLDYWQAWMYLAILIIPATFVVTYFLKNDLEFLERRMKLKEKQVKQQLVVKLSGIIFIVGFLLPGFDRRFGWSSVPPELVIAADVVVFLGYLFIFLVFRENSFAGRTIEVVKGQKVISTGPYSVIRHPMYLGTILMWTATPIALGSYWALPAFLLIVPLLVLRILNEEEVLRRELPGYKEYCNKTRYRLLPFVW